jgi:hypothetical protein
MQQLYVKIYIYFQLTAVFFFLLSYTLLTLQHVSVDTNSHYVRIKGMQLGAHKYILINLYALYRSKWFIKYVVTIRP